MILVYDNAIKTQEESTMYEVKNEDIGTHVSELIHDKYKSVRQFCQKYLEERYQDFDDTALKNIQNRFSQILNGNKGVQLDDLPVLSHLLGVSMEDIVSAGTSFAPVTNRVTNYSIANSQDEKEWEKYINRDDKLILNADEYNKTVIEYALEAGNYEFLKYLVNKGYIWFVGTDKNEYHRAFGNYDAGFGAGTNIKRRTIGFNDDLATRQKNSDDLRFNMIYLAIKNKDYDMLEKLHAREIPLLYDAGRLPMLIQNPGKIPSSKNVDKFISILADASDEMITYFFKPITIDCPATKETNTFFFPYAGMVLDLMIKRKKSTARAFLKTVTKYNKSVNKQLTDYLDISIRNSKEYFEQFENPDYYTDDFIRTNALYYYYFYPDTGFVSYTTINHPKGEKCLNLVANIIRVTAKSSSIEIQDLIDELNETYTTFEKYLEKEEPKNA